jgi:hypothetical protein
VIRPQHNVGRVVYEAELGIVIGKRGRDIPIEEAAQFIFGYTCVNDVTAVELLRSDTSFEQWTRAKNFDSFTPFGPWIETDLDCANAIVTAKVNGRERQNYPVSDMFFSPAELVANSCLFVMGSEGRGEQLLKTDQDNGLILRDGYTPPHNLEAICQDFSNALTTFGYPECPGHIMVNNPMWRKSAYDFGQMVKHWLILPEADSLMNLGGFVKNPVMV